MSDPKVLTLDVVEKMLEAQAEQNRLNTLELVKAMKAPVDKTPEQLAQTESDKAMRAETARLQLEKLQNTANIQAACTHRRKDRTTHCVFEYGGGYLICQGCQGIIHPEPRPTGATAKETSHHIYNNRMFSEHFAESQAGNTTF